MANESASRRQFIKACGIVAVQAAVAGRAAEAQWDLSTISKQFRFARGSEGMLPGYTDYSLETTGFDFLAEVRELPASVEVQGNNRNAFYIQGDNHSDDLFMFL